MESRTLLERGMNLAVQAAMIPMHLTSLCSSQNMTPETLIYVKNATIAAQTLPYTACPMISSVQNLTPIFSFKEFLYIDFKQT